MASALAKVDISDSAHLKALLTETDNAQNFIKEFQTNNVIALESLAPALPLLDLHGVSRFEFHDSVFEQERLSGLHFLFLLEIMRKDFSLKWF